MQKVIIIGAGPAGLTAGYELLKNSDKYEVLILEESDQVGGISKTVCHNGNRMDIGGHRFFSKDQRVVQWWQDMLPLQGAPAYDDKVLNRSMPLVPSGPDPEETDKVMLNRNRVSRIYFKGKFFDYPVKMNKTTVKNMGFADTLHAGGSYILSTVHKRPEDSLENFYINRFGKKLYGMFFEGYTEKLWGRAPRDISADWGAQRVKGLSVIAVLKDILNKKRNAQPQKVETSLIEAFCYPKFGPGQLWETAAAKFEALGGRILKNSRVTNMSMGKQGIEAVRYTTSSQSSAVTAEADIVISSMPLKDLISGMNDVPQEVRNIAEGLPYRDFVTVGLLVDRLELKNETDLKTLGDILPDCWIYVQDAGVKMGRIQVFNNWSPYMVADPEHTVWIGLEYFCDEGDEYWTKSREEWVSFAIDELIKMKIISGSENVLDRHCEKVKKAYPAYFDTYAEIDALTEWISEIPNLYCVGRNGQHRYNNMDHSMATSFEAVNNILTGAKDKKNIWSVNTEQEYHEEKQDMQEKE